MGPRRPRATAKHGHGIVKVRFVRRQYFRRFLRPINRLRLSPAVVGRTAVVGLAFGLTASVGIQLIGVFLIWLVGRAVRRPINLALAVVLTGVTNPLTIAPIYTVYFLTGCAVIRCDTSVITIEPLLAAINAIDFRALFTGSWDMAMASFGQLGSGSWETIGLPLAITVLGSLPFALVGSVAGYYFGRYVGERLHVRRVRRAALRARQAQAAKAAQTGQPAQPAT